MSLSPPDTRPPGSPTRRRSLKHLELYSNASLRVELAVINVRVLARGAANAVRRGDTIPPVLPEAVRDLSQAVRSLADFLERPGPPDEVRRYALEAARAATEILKERGTTSPRACSSARYARRRWTS